MSGEYKQVRSLSRGLQVLASLNMANGSPAAALAQATGLHRATVHRILETLIAEGYVTPSTGDGRYYLRLKVKSLGAGFGEEAWLNELAPSILSELNERVPWPCDLATLDGDEMVVRESSARWSAFSLHQAVIGRRLSLLTTALGRAYLSFCGDEEREIILLSLKAHISENEKWALRVLPDVIAEARTLGYARNSGENDPRFNALALPVYSGGQVIACLNVRMYARAMSVDEGARKYLPAMREAVRALQLGLASPAAAGLRIAS